MRLDIGLIIVIIDVKFAIVIKADCGDGTGGLKATERGRDASVGTMLSIPDER